MRDQNHTGTRLGIPGLLFLLALFIAIVGLAEPPADAAAPSAGNAAASGATQAQPWHTRVFSLAPPDAPDDTVASGAYPLPSPTPTHTATPVPPTATPTFVSYPYPYPSPPTSTPTPTNTPTSTPTNTPTPTPTNTPTPVTRIYLPLILQS